MRIEHLVSSAFGINTIYNLYQGITTGNKACYIAATLNGILAIGIDSSVFADYIKRKKATQWLRELDEAEKRDESKVKQSKNKLVNLAVES